MDDRRERRDGAVRGGFGAARRLAAVAIALILIVALAACEPSAPPGVTLAPSAPAGGPTGSASAAPEGSAVAGSPAVTVDGATVRIVGLGNGVSPDFDLPAGNATMTVSVCKSNQVIPFVTFFDAAGTKLAIIVEPEYDIKNLVGGKYRFEVASNPDCVWTIEVTPA